MHFVIYDGRNQWAREAMIVAKAHGFTTRRIERFAEFIPAPGLGFVRPSTNPKLLRPAQALYERMVKKLMMVQDATQIQLYDSKIKQLAAWAEFMPPTWYFTSKDRALAFIESEDAPEQLVSKADVGSASKNIRLLYTRAEQRAHINEVFDRGIKVTHCSGGGDNASYSTQRNYLLLQKLVPHLVTWRVNAIGRGRAIFKRYCYAERQVAQSGNVEPVMELDAQTRSLLEFSNQIFATLGTNWCAIDVLQDEAAARWYLLETSLAWPWPSPGDCMSAPFFGVRGYNWTGMWRLLFDEYEAGVWSA
jgi:glutathione synthase/RimK-type ligase-like ATP-grasp enzyme